MHHYPWQQEQIAPFLQYVRQDLNKLEDIMSSYKQKILEREIDIHAWAHLPQQLSTQISEIGSGELSGVPFGVKDVLDVAGMPTASGVQDYSPAPSSTDAACVASLRAAGAIPLGKTVTAEYAFRQAGPTRNPHNLEHTPGGSSSGSAAAVAAGMVPFALSTQTGGSIIRPAAFCGVVGLKPSFGLVSRAGMKLNCDSLDVIGWHAATIQDAQAVARVLLPDATARLADSPVSLKISYLDWSPVAELQPEARRILEQVRDFLAQRFDVSRHFSHTAASQLSTAHDVIMSYELARNVRPFIEAGLGKPSSALVEIVAQGLAVSQQAYLQALVLRGSLSQAWDELSGGADLILTASVPGAAPQGLAYTGSPAFCKIWSVLGWPCLHVPIGNDPQGLPIGVQLIGPMYSDHQLLVWGQELQTFNRERQNEN